MYNYFVLQAQTIGLWGEPFAAACVVVSEEMEVKEEHYLACPSVAAYGLDREWVDKNVLPHLPNKCECIDAHDICERIWQIWIRCKQQYPNLYCASHIAFPIAMNLFGHAVTQNVEERWRQAPYPLLEINTAFLLTNHAISPDAIPRLEQEKPCYNPLCDAKYYSRLFLLARKRIQQVGISFEALSKRPLCGIDAKSRGLWGDIFYFGSVIYNKDNKEEIGNFRTWKIPEAPEEIARDDVWREPYLDLLKKVIDCQNQDELNEKVWKFIRRTQKSNALFISWSPFPVDWRALGEAIKVNLSKRQLKTPYPIHDTATALFLAGKDPVANYPRQEGEVIHDPVGSARLAVRLFINCDKVPQFPV